MLTSLSNFFYQKSSLLVCVCITGITFGYIYLVLQDVAACFEIADSTIVSLGISFGYSREMVEQFFAARTPEMITCYQELLIVWDGIFAILYGVMYVCRMSYLLRPYMEKVSILNLLPFLQTILDRGENHILVQLADNHLAGEYMPSFVIYTASTYTVVKWVVALCVLCILVIVIGKRVQALYGKRRG